MNELSTTTNFGKDELDLIKSIKTPGATQAEFNLFVYDANARGLNPLKNEIYFVKRGTGEYAKASHQVGIDGFRVIAQRTGEYEGQTPVKYAENQVEVCGVLMPEWVETGVYRKGFREALVCRAYAKEYFQVAKDYKTGAEKPSGIWGKMPIVMLSKCSESIALRKAFPDALAGLYTNEEMPPEEQPKHVENKVVETAPAFHPPEVPVGTKSSDDDLPFPADTPDVEIIKDVADPNTGEVLASAGDVMKEKKSPKTGKKYRVVLEPAGNFKGCSEKTDKPRFLTETEWTFIANLQK